MQYNTIHNIQHTTYEKQRSGPAARLTIPQYTIYNIHDIHNTQYNSTIHTATLITGWYYLKDGWQADC